MVCLSASLLCHALNSPLIKMIMGAEVTCGKDSVKEMVGLDSFFFQRLKGTYFSYQNCDEIQWKKNFHEIKYS